MNRIATWGTRAAITAGAFALVAGVGVGTAFAAEHPSANGAKGPKGAELSALVTAGTITEAEKEAFRYEMYEAKEAVEATGAKPDCAVIKANVLRSLVSDGTLTQAKADAIDAVRPPRPGAGPRESADPGENAGPSNSAGPRNGAGIGGDGGPLAALVADGTITQAQADAIKAARPERPGAGPHHGGVRPAPLPAS